MPTIKLGLKWSDFFYFDRIYAESKAYKILTALLFHRNIIERMMRKKDVLPIGIEQTTVKKTKSTNLTCSMFTISIFINGKFVGGF